MIPLSFPETQEWTYNHGCRCLRLLCSGADDFVVKFKRYRLSNGEKSLSISRLWSSLSQRTGIHLVSRFPGTPTRNPGRQLSERWRV